MSKHAKVRPYRCNVCGWTAAYNGNMWKHIENHQKVLGDQMPEFPVSVMSGGVDTLNMPTALRAPSGKRRGQGKSDGDPSSPTSKPKVKRSRTKYSEPPSGVILANRSAVQEVSVTVQEVPMAVQVARSMAQDVQPQAPPPQPQPHPLPQSIINTEGMVIQVGVFWFFRLSLPPSMLKILQTIFRIHDGIKMLTIYLQSNYIFLIFLFPLLSHEIASESSIRCDGRFALMVLWWCCGWCGG